MTNTHVCWANISDLKDPHWIFINDIHKKCLRSTEFIHWSQKWEYPWAIKQLQEAGAKPGDTVFDIGSGISVFPEILSRLGFNVIATDYHNNIRKVDGVEIRIVDGFMKPTEKHQFVTCISVIEHVFRGRGGSEQLCLFFDNLFQRIEPGGCLILTMDRYSGARNDVWEMSPEFFDELTNHMRVTVPTIPADILNSCDCSEAVSVDGNIVVLGTSFRNTKGDL